MDVRAHRKLEVWQKSLLLVKVIYEVTKVFPETERFGLTSQLRRAAISIPSNLAEGAARRGKKEFVHFMNISQGSLSELDTQIELSKLLGYLEDKIYSQVMADVTTISKMLYGLARRNQS